MERAENANAGLNRIAAFLGATDEVGQFIDVGSRNVARATKANCQVLAIGRKGQRGYPGTKAGDCLDDAPGLEREQ